MKVGLRLTLESTHCLPRQRGNVRLSNLQVVNAILYAAEHGCKWRGLLKRFGNWHTIYTRMNRWTKAGVLDRMFEELPRAQVVRIKIEAVSLDSTNIKVLCAVCVAGAMQWTLQIGPKAFELPAPQVGRAYQSRRRYGLGRSRWDLS
jgi:transposase